MGFCLDLFTIMIGVGAVLYILLGLFSLFGFEVLETHANKWGNNSVFTKPLDICYNKWNIVVSEGVLLTKYFRD